MLSDRSRKRTKTFNKAYLLCFLALVAVVTAISAVYKYSPGASRLKTSFEQVQNAGLPAPYVLSDCTPASKLSVCKWARQYSRADRKRPPGWKPKPGWFGETKTSKQKVHHKSDRALHALTNSSAPAVNSDAAQRPLQAVLESVWHLHKSIQNTNEHPPANERAAAELLQCAPFTGQTCVALLGNASIPLTGLQDCLVVRLMDSTETCPEKADIWITQQLPSSSHYLGMGGRQGCSQAQVLQGTKAVWFLGGQVNQVQEDCSSDVFSKVSAVHFPMNEWVHQYTSSLPADTKATDQQPSALYVGLMSVLECVPGTMPTHVYTSVESNSQCQRCDEAFEHSLLANLTQASLIMLHTCNKYECEAVTGQVYPVQQGAMTAGVKMYIHKAKWQQDKGKVYRDDEEEDDDNT